LCGQTDYFVSRAQVTFIKSDSALVYAACPQEGCNKKVTEEGPHMFRCEKCGKVYDRCNFRYNLSVQISDFTSSMWVSMFNDEAEAIFGEKADQLIAWRQQVRARASAAAHLGSHWAGAGRLRRRFVPGPGPTFCRAIRCSNRRSPRPASRKSFSLSVPSRKCSTYGAFAHSSPSGTTAGD